MALFENRLCKIIDHSNEEIRDMLCAERSEIPAQEFAVHLYHTDSWSKMEQWALQHFVCIDATSDCSLNDYQPSINIPIPKTCTSSFQWEAAIMNQTTGGGFMYYAPCAPQHWMRHEHAMSLLDRVLSFATSAIKSDSSTRHYAEKATCTWMWKEDYESFKTLVELSLQFQNASWLRYVAEFLYTF